MTKPTAYCPVHEELEPIRGLYRKPGRQSYEDTKAMEYGAAVVQAVLYCHHRESLAVDGDWWDYIRRHRAGVVGE